MTTLASFAPGQRCKILSIHANEVIRQRLIDMGLIPQTEVTIERLAPMGSPIWINLMGFELALRSEEAQSIDAEAIE